MQQAHGKFWKEQYHSKKDSIRMVIAGRTLRQTKEPRT